MRKSTLLRVVPLVALFCGAPVFAAQSVTTTLLHDAFAAADKNAGLTSDANDFLKPTASQAAWFGGGAVPQYTQNSDIKMSAGTNGIRGLLAYFSPSTKVETLAVGETLTATVKFKYTDGTGASSAGDFRMGFLNSGGNGGPTNDGASANPRPDGEAAPAARIKADNFSLTAGGNTPRGYSGYFVSSMASTSPSTNSMSFWRRAGGQGRSQQWLGPTSSDVVATVTMSQVGQTGGGLAGPVSNNGTEYVATFAVTYVSAPILNDGGDVVGKGSLKLAYTVTSAGSTVMSHSVTESADAPLVGFDTFMILSTYNAAIHVLDFTVARTSIAPAFTLQPVSAVKPVGSSLTLTAAASGAPTPTYQWQKWTDGTFVDIAGATQATLSFASLLTTDAGRYLVIATNSAGSKTSDEAIVTVLTTPEITAQAADKTIYEGQSATLTVGVRGAPTLVYQWKKDGSDLANGGGVSGADTAALTLSAVDLAANGVYTLVISNGYGTVTSTPVTLTVLAADPPSIVSQPASQSVVEGTDVSFAVTLEGTSPFTYQWKKDGVALVDDGRIAGATTGTLTIGSARLADAGAYAVSVSNVITIDAPVVSAAAALAVTAAPAPLPPVAVTARNITETSFLAKWTRATHATGYRLDVSTDAAFGSFIAGYEDLEVGAALSWPVSGLTIDTTYYYRLRAYNSSGTSVASNSMAVTVLTPVAPAFTSVASTVFTAGVPGSFTVTASGSPAPFFSATGLPAWLSLDATTGVLSGTPPAATADNAQFTFTLTAQNDKKPDATQAFTLTVQNAPVITEPFEITTLAGKALTSGTADGTGTAARFAFPMGVALDDGGDVYVADSGSHTLRKVTAAGVVTTLAGTAGVAGSADGASSVATFDTPSGVAVDSTGNVYIADTLNHTIRKLTAAGVVTTLAGQAGASGSVDGTAGAARFFGPQGLALDAAGTHLYVADTNNDTIRRIVVSSGVVTTLAGAAGQAGSADGLGTVARFNGPTALAVDDSGTLYVADTDNHIIRTITSAGTVTTLAGRAGRSGASDGTGQAAAFNHPSAIAVDGSSNLYVLDTDNHTIRKIVSAAGVVTTLAGQPGESGSADGAGTVDANGDALGSAARFNYPAGLAATTDGDLYIADTNNHVLRYGAMPHAPVITVQPQSQTTTVGGSVTFSLKASGAPAPTYQWYRGTTVLTGETADTLALSSVTTANAGDYTCEVANVLGGVTSAAATLVVNPATTSTPVGLDSGGGGAPSGWFYLALAALGAARWFLRRSRR
jgi:sugar lactone lactonase YvrE